MNNSLPIADVFLAVFLSAALIFALRAFPFVLFSRKNPPAVLRFIERYIPPMVMAILVVYCLKDVSFTSAPYGLRELSSIVVVIILHLWKKNAFVSIFGGTALYMILGMIL